MKFIVVGNGHMPVSSPAQRELAARAMRKEGIGVATVYVGAPGFADESGEVMCDEGRIERARRHFHGEGEYS